MAGPQSNEPFADDDDDGGGESTVSMASPFVDAGAPSPVSSPPPARSNNLSVPTAPAPFTPGSPASFPQQARPPGGTSVPTPFGGLTPNAPAPKPLPAAGAPPAAGPTGAVGQVPGMKRPQTVIGLAPPPVGAPRPGQAGRGALPSKGAAAQGGPVTPRPAVGGPAGDKSPPSSGRGVKPPASSQKPLTGGGAKPADANATGKLPPHGSAPGAPDTQKEGAAKSADESLFGVDSGLTDAARAAVVPKPAPARSVGGLPPVPAPPTPNKGAREPSKSVPVLHDKTEEDESTRAVSRDEMLRNNDGVVVIGDEEDVQGEDATLAVAPGYNEAARNQHLAAIAAQGSPLGGPMPPAGMPPPAQQQPQWPQPAPQAYPQPQQQQQWHDPHAGYNPHQSPAQSWTPNPPQGYPGMQVGPGSGSHMPVGPQGYSQVPQSQPHMQVPPSGHMMAHAPQPGGPMAYSGNQTAQPAPFGDWNANAAHGRKSPKISKQILLLGIVGVVCLAIFVTGIILFATTKF